MDLTVRNYTTFTICYVLLLRTRGRHFGVWFSFSMILKDKVRFQICSGYIWCKNPCFCFCFLLKGNLRNLHNGLLMSPCIHVCECICTNVFYTDHPGSRLGSNHWHSGIKTFCVEAGTPLCLIWLAANLPLGLNTLTPGLVAEAQSWTLLTVKPRLFSLILR